MQITEIAQMSNEKEMGNTVLMHARALTLWWRVCGSGWCGGGGGCGGGSVTGQAGRCVVRAPSGL